jgi:hypothetical protein
MMSRLVVGLFVLALTMPGTPVRAGAEATKLDALVGSWVLNVAKSKMQPPPKSQVRTFDYTHDGMMMCTLRSENQNGSRSMFHWFTTLDGVQHPEFTRGNGSNSTTTIALKKIDDHNFEIKGITIASGKTHLTGTGSISADGKTMTWTTKNVNLQTGAENDQVRIYEKETEREGR